jgi:hypothetical protein
MPINKPYNRISRPFTNGNYLQSISNTYLLDEQYATKRFSSIRAFHILLADLIKLLDYVEPTDGNSSTYSHKIYELFLRASTEFESNCKLILESNGYHSSGHLNITDYFKINKASKLNEYEVIFNAWSPSPLNLKPFAEWNSTTFSPLTWYQKYNIVKHHREQEFESANLENLMNSIAGVFVLLYTQFNIFSFEPYQIIGSSMSDNNGFISTESSLFKIKPPSSWPPEESYDFDWNSIKNDTVPVSKFSF